LLGGDQLAGESMLAGEAGLGGDQLSGESGLFGCGAGATGAGCGAGCWVARGAGALAGEFDAGDFTEAGLAGDGLIGDTVFGEFTEIGEVGDGLTMLSLFTRKVTSAPPVPFTSAEVEPVRSPLPVNSGIALAAVTAPLAITPRLRAPAAPMAIQFFGLRFVAMI